MVRFTFVASLALAGLLAACGGEIPQPVSVIRATDSQMSCMKLLLETQNNEHDMARLAARDEMIHRRNVHFTVVDGVMFFPALLTLDYRQQPEIERTALVERNKHLIELADAQGC